MAKRPLVLVPGAAGFIGYHTVLELLRNGYRVVGLDNLNDYYDVRLKKYRMGLLKNEKGFIFHKADIEKTEALKAIFKEYRPQAVINLAARAGVRKSLENPRIYCTTNILGVLNLLEMCRQFKVKKFILASTSSLYAGGQMPFSERLAVNTPISPYAATKKSAEAMAYTYHFLYDIDVTVLRYFTVYGPMGRPDMSYFRFIQAMQEGRSIEVFGDGAQSRDFTYVVDIAAGTVAALKKVGHEVVNLGSDKPYPLTEMITLIEKALGKTSTSKHQAFPKVDMRDTWANIDKAKELLGWQPQTSLKEGIDKTVQWHLQEQSWLSHLKKV